MRRARGRSLGRLAGVLGLALAVLVACGDDDEDGKKAAAPPEPPTLYAGAAEGKLDVSVGTPMAGFTGRNQRLEFFRLFTGGIFLKLPDDRVSPFADMLFPSIGVHTPPTAKAVALELRWTDRSEFLVFARVETCFMTDVLRRRVEILVSRALGRDVTDHLILSATHTHNGPGRIWPLPYIGDLSFDTFDAGITERIAKSIADVIVAALGDLRAARIGMNVYHGLDPEDLLFYDRRSNNDDADLLTNDNPFRVDADGLLVPDGEPDGPMKDDRLTLVRVEGKDGIPIAVLFSFPVHGTVLGPGNLYLSGDLPGMTEQKLSELLGRPAPVTMFFAGAEGDVNPVDDWRAYQKLEESGEILATRIKNVYDATPVSDSLVGLSMRGATVRQDYMLLGYPDAEPPYDQFQATAGAAMCGVVVESAPFYCISRPELQVPDVWYMGIASKAIALYFCRIFGLCEEDLMLEFIEAANEGLPEFQYPTEVFTERYHVARLSGIRRRVMDSHGMVLADGPAEVFLLSQPGEPLTTYSYQLRGDLLVQLAAAGLPGVTADDLVLVGLSQDSAGYLVPRRDWLQGGYEISINVWGPFWAEHVQRNIEDLTLELVTGEARVAGQALVERGEPLHYQPMPVTTDGIEILQQPGDGTRFDSFTMTWRGGDPGVDQPVVTLQRDQDGEFQDVLRRDGRPITSDDYRLILFYADDNTWKIHWELAEDEPAGTYRFVARGKNYDGAPQSLSPPYFTGTPYELVSEPFRVTSGPLTVRVPQVLPDRVLVNVLYPDNTPELKRHVPSHFRFRPLKPGSFSYKITFTDYDDPATVYVTEGETTLPGDAPASIALFETLPPGTYILDLDAADPYGNRGALRIVRDFF